MRSLIWIGLFLAGCATTRVPTTAEVTLQPGDTHVGTYISKPKGFTTSSYWIEGPKGLVIIDTQFLLSSADELINWAEQTTGKKVVLGVVLHPNPDKFNGAAVFKRRGIPVVTSDQVKALIPEVHKDRHYWFYDRFKPDYPDLAPVIESFGSKSTTLDAAGVPVKVHVMGKGCSDAHVVAEYDGHVFVGDLIANLHHSWMEIGQLEEWLKRLAEIKAMKPQYVHPGRGPSGGPELIDREISYLQKVKELILKEHPHGDPDDEKIARVQKKLETLYPYYGNAYFLEIGLPAVWAEYAKK